MTSTKMAATVTLGVPPAMEQREIIEALESEEESLHVYAVTKTWYERWRVFVGLNDTTTNPTYPGLIDMDRASEDSNMYVDEKIWLKWVDWYGLSDFHELDRRNWTSDEKEFEICTLSPYSGILENPTKTLDVSDETGYIELQLRRIFQVHEFRQTRLWVCEKVRHARFQLVLDRGKEIGKQEFMDAKKYYILALEVSNLDGTWASHNPGIPRGSLTKYKAVIGCPRDPGSWCKDLATTLDSVFTGISHELSETVSGIVKTTRCVSSCAESDLGLVKDRLETRMRSVEEVQKMLNKKAKDVLQEEELMKTEMRRFKRDRDNFDQERQNFHDEVKQMETINQIHDTRIKLNIGGHIYMTSTLTLLKDPESMLAAMFSGRHSLKQEDDSSYFIDRDGTHFRFILNYLRDGGFRDGTLPKDKTFLNELLTEAEYYQLGTLVKMLADVLKGGKGEGSDAEGSPKPERKQSSGKRPHRKVALLK